MIEPLNGFVVLEKNEAKNTTAGGILLSAAPNSMTLEGKVIAVSNDVPLLSKGADVIYMNGKGVDVKVEGRNYVMIHSTSIIAIVKSGN